LRDQELKLLIDEQNKVSEKLNEFKKKFAPVEEAKQQNNY